MNVTISRFWSHNDDEGNTRAVIFFKRPRVDGRIADYVFGYIREKVLDPKKLMQKGDYAFTLYFDVIRKRHVFFYDSVYNTDAEKFHPAFRDRKYNGSKVREISIACYSNALNETITPTEYAKLVYDMFASYFVENLKKTSKEEFDRFKYGMDFDVINAFPFPAPFDAQNYSGDNGSVEKRVVNFVVDEASEAYVYKDAYIAHYGF